MNIAFHALQTAGLYAHLTAGVETGGGVRDKSLRVADHTQEIHHLCYGQYVRSRPCPLYPYKTKKGLSASSS